MTQCNAYHISGTMDQANSDLWHSMRKLSITGTKFKKFSTNPIAILKEHYFPSENVGDRPAVKWGRDHESVAIQKYESKYGKVQHCGLFVSKKYPNYAATPDSITRDMIIEIKCSFSIKGIIF